MRFSLGRAALAVAAVTVVAISPTMAGFASGALGGGVTITPAVITLGGQTPTVVLNHQATDLGAGNPDQPLAINLVLPLRNQSQLTQFLAGQDTTRQVMTQGQIADLFLPNQSQVDAIRDWAAQHTLHVAAVSANRTLVTLQGTTSAVDTALSVQIHNYRSAKGQRFFSNDRDATVPATLGITAVSGLDNLQRFQTSLSTQPLKAALTHAAASAIYLPVNFRTAYNVTHDGTGQTIGFTLWGTSLPQADLNKFASDTADTKIVAGQPGANGIDWVFPTPGITPATYHNDALDETAMDVEYAHAMAPNAHLIYYLGDQFSTIDTNCNCYDPTNVGLENAVAAAASPSDPNMHVVSNSWLGSEPTSINDSFLTATQQSFQLAKAAGITFYFASGDTGSNSGGAGAPAYPADSPYVVAVGGTTLTFNAGVYGSETTWSGSGGGCSRLSANARPSWQVFTGINIAPTCSGRAEPDVSADADPNTGAYVDYDTGGATIPAEIGGTSLATPLWAGMTAAADSLAVADGRTVLPFTGPVIYGCANNASPYPANCRSAYHDVTTGNNGLDSAGTGWDEATGWGSINWDTWAQDVVLAQPLASPTSSSTATATATSTPASGGSLAGVAGAAAGTVNLTSEGTADWGAWGLSSAGSFDHKANVVSQLSTYTVVGGGTASQATVPTLFSWSDGTPDGANKGTGVAVAVTNVGQGFALSVPADLTPRTLHVYVGVYRAGAAFNATLSDGSASPYSMTTLNNQYGLSVEEYTLTYHAGTAGQTLHISFTMTANHSFGDITLEAATLVGGTGGVPSSTPSVTPTQTSSPTPSSTPTRTPTPTQTGTATPTTTVLVGSATSTGTSTTTSTPTRTATATTTATTTGTATSTPTATLTPTATGTSTSTGTRTATLTPSATVAGGVGSLAGTAGPAAGPVNLTSEGTADWAAWGLSSAGSFDHKANVVSQLSTYTVVGGGTASQATVPTLFSWSDGTPDGTNNGTGVAVAVTNLGQGFALSVPADLTPRTLHVYVGVYRAGGAFSATLSDGSASPYSMTTLNNQYGLSVEEYSLTYHAGTAGQTLHISFTMTANHSFGDITLEAATLVGGTGGVPSSTPTQTTTTTPTSTPTRTITPTQTGTATSTTTVLVGSATSTGTATTTSTPTRTATTTTTATATGTATSTPTTTATPTATGTSTSTGTRTATLTPSATVAGGVGSLAGTAGPAAGPVNLTSEGTADWAAWGLSSAASFDHKANVSSQVSTYTVVGGGTASQATVPTLFSWSDGTPDGANNGTGVAVAVTNLGQGFALSVPADLTPRTLHVYVGVYRAGGAFSATLSDGSASPYSMTTLNNQYGLSVEEYSLTYHAGTAGQTLHLSFTMTANHSFGDITLEAATLSST